MTTIVVTGSTRGIGRGLAESFLERGCNVVVSGRGQDSVDATVEELAERFGAGRVLGVACDVRDVKANQSLWDAAIERFGRVDVWLMNAGVSADRRPLWELPADEITSVVETNVLGSLLGAKVAATGMLEQGGGRIYVMEGFGSRGEAREGLLTYTSSKRGVAYLPKALRKDLGKDSPVKVGAVSPGMVITDMLVGDYDRDSADWERVRRIFNILADRVEDVTPWLADRILADPGGGRIAWLTRGKAFRRFATAPFSRRDLFGDDA